MLSHIAEQASVVLDADVSTPRAAFHAFPAVGV